LRRSVVVVAISDGMVFVTSNSHYFLILSRLFLKPSMNAVVVAFFLGIFEK